jgi:hypothetical protein
MSDKFTSPTSSSSSTWSPYEEEEEEEDEEDEDDDDEFVTLLAPVVVVGAGGCPLSLSPPMVRAEVGGRADKGRVLRMSVSKGGMVGKELLVVEFEEEVLLVVLLVHCKA